MDPYNRRQIWDLIIKAKRGRSIILCSHHLEEVDLLSDRVAILKKGKIITCGSTLFLKHHFGVGYSLRFDAPFDIDVSSLIRSDGAEATQVEVQKPGSYQWNLSHGSEPSFPSILSKLDHEGATSLSLELTTLEQVFLATGKEEEATENNSAGDSANSDGGDDSPLDMDDPNVKHDFLRKVWKRRDSVKSLSFWQKYTVVERFMMLNAWRVKEAISINIAFPLVYMVAGMVIVYLVGEPDEATRVNPEPIELSQYLVGGSPTRFFGFPDGYNATSIAPIIASSEPSRISDYFDADPVIGGYYAENSTLQYNPEYAFALQVGEHLLSNYDYMTSNNRTDGIFTRLVPLPYDTGDPFRVDFLVLPLAIIYGFNGLVMAVLDVLMLKSDHIIELFRVAGISEWTALLGIIAYKTKTTFLPFFTLVVILGISFKSTLFGNGGRWLATLLNLLLYAFSATPLGLILAKRFFTKDFDSVKNWFPGVYMTFISLPYVAWNLALQNLPDSRDALLIIGDILSILPPFAIQRGLGAVIEVSPYADDDELSWGDVWNFEDRVPVILLIMFAVGSIEYWYLNRLVSARPSITALTDDEKNQVVPLDATVDPDLSEERARSLSETDGIRSRDLVKVFKIDLGKDESNKRKKMLKRAVKGVSFGIKKNEVYVLLGPNGEFLM